MSPGPGCQVTHMGSTWKPTSSRTGAQFWLQKTVRGRLIASCTKQPQQQLLERSHRSDPVVLPVW